MGPETAATENLLNKYFFYDKNGHSLTVINLFFGNHLKMTLKNARTLFGF